MDQGFIEPEEPVQLVLTVEKATRGGFDIPVSYVVFVVGAVGVLVIIGAAVVIYMLRRDADEEERAKECEEVEVVKVIEEKD